MSKSSPLKHKEGDVKAHWVRNQYHGEEYYHEAYPDDVIVKEKPIAKVEEVKDNSKEKPHRGIPKIKSAKEGHYYQNITHNDPSYSILYY